MGEGTGSQSEEDQKEAIVLVLIFAFHFQRLFPEAQYSSFLRPESGVTANYLALFYWSIVECKVGFSDRCGIRATRTSLRVSTKP